MFAFRLHCREAPSRDAAERALARARAPHARGEALLLLGRHEDALAVLSPHEEDARARVAHARVLQQEVYARGLTAGAARELEDRWGAVIERDPGLHAPHLMRGLVRMEVGDRRAVEDVARGCALAPPWFAASAFQLAGYVHLRLGDPAASARALDRALLVDEWNSQARKQRGLLRRAQGDLAGARADLERQAAELPASGDTELWLALVELRSHDGDAAGAIAATERMREVLGDLPAVRLAVVRALAQAGDLAAAEARASDLLRPGAPDDARAPTRRPAGPRAPKRGDAQGASPTPGGPGARLSRPAARSRAWPRATWRAGR
ncbi:MAG: hypothetical protein KF878_05410 [Planctomycetes bacterium]|nr:hypothetical protein [Planctomycetota bacterium]